MSAAAQSRPSAQTEGTLDAVSVPQLLVEAWRDRRTGSLCLTRDKSEWRIEVIEGAPVSLDYPNAEDRFAQTLEDARTISGPDRAKAETLAAERGCSQATAVHAMGLLDAKALYRALRTETRNQIGSAFDWRQGRYAWLPSSTDGKPSAKGFDILSLVQEQLPRRWGIDRLFEELMPHSEEVCELSPGVRRVTERLAATGPMAQRMIAGLDGATSIGRLLGDSSGDPLAASTLWVLLKSGAVRSSRAEDDDADQAIEFEVLVDDGAFATAGDPSMMTARARPTQARGSSDANAQALRAEVAEVLGQLGDLTHYEALGLEVDATPGQIKKSYFKAAKKFHPDVLARLNLDDLREEASEVFGRIAEAFEILSNPKKRAAYDAGDSEATEIDTARLTQAETAFRKGEILLKMGNYRGSLEFLERAVELWPEEPAYQAALGWSLFRQPQCDAARAKTHLSLAAGQAPEDAPTLFRLGLVLQSLKEDQAAEDFMAEARRIDPDVTE